MVGSAGLASEEPQPLARPRTNSRLRGEAPPGMHVGEEARQRIGRYEVVKTIGKGAMGVVYKARDPLLDRVVAVKTIMSPQGQGRRVRSAFLERFQREAKAAAKMQHPAIVTIFDVGVDEESGAPFMVLEYLPGESLADRLDRVRIPLARGVQIALDLASALSFAHRQRIVHRDVKPANVLHAGDNRWKLADFGIARMPDSDLTQVGIFMGTPGYSPPEAIREGRYTPQADVFAWGAVFYELLSGRIPYEGPDTKTTNGYVVQGNAPPPTRHDASIPEPLATVTMTALMPSDRSRFKDASEAEQSLREAWDRCLTQGLVHPAVLAMEEQAHDKAPARMHEPRGGAAPPRASAALPAAGPPVMPIHPPVVGADSAEVTAIDSKMLQRQQGAFLIESTTKRTGDDDPTTLVVRDELKPPKGPTTSPGMGPSNPGKTPVPERQSAKQVAQASHAAQRGDEATPTSVDGKQRFGASIAEREPPSRLVWIIIAVIIVLAGAVAGLYFAGLIK
jgi:eukaryotic-like serine/threonine-protein kinase